MTLDFTSLASFTKIFIDTLNKHAPIKKKYIRANDENKKIELNGGAINNTQVQKLLGVHIDYKLKFDTHIKSLCKKVGKKFHALARIIKYMSINQATNQTN